MNYFELRDQLEALVKEKNIDGIMALINVDSVKVINKHKMALVGRQSFYEGLRKSIPRFAKLTDEHFEILYNSEISNEERQERLKDLGFEIITFEKLPQWHPFK